MVKSAFLVDGHLEQEFIKRQYPGRPIKRINCNGRDVELSTMAKFIATQCRILNNKYFPIIIIVDREDRDVTSNDMGKQLVELLKSEGISDTIIIGVADRMIENWILADVEVVNNHKNNKKNIKGCCEGQNGKSIMNGVIRHYHETTVGVELLENCRASKIKNNSRSFKDFYERLPRNECFWLKR